MHIAHTLYPQQKYSDVRPGIIYYTLYIATIITFYFENKHSLSRVGNSGISNVCTVTEIASLLPGFMQSESKTMSLSDVLTPLTTRDSISKKLIIELL